MDAAWFGFIGVIVGAALPLTSGWVTRYLEKKRSAEHLAIRITCVLDQYIEECLDVAIDDGLYLGQRESDGTLSAQSEHPKPPEYPAEAVWASVEKRIMYAALALQTETTRAVRVIDSVVPFSDPPDYEPFFETRRIEFSKLGLKAIAIADELRRTYKIFELDHQSELKVRFEQSIAAVQEAIQRRQESNEKFEAAMK